MKWGEFKAAVEAKFREKDPYMRFVRDECQVRFIDVPSGATTDEIVVQIFVDPNGPIEFSVEGS